MIMSEIDSDEDNVIRYGTPLEPYEEGNLTHFHIICQNNLKIG